MEHMDRATLGAYMLWVATGNDRTAEVETLLVDYLRDEDGRTIDRAMDMQDRAREIAECTPKHADAVAGLLTRMAWELDGVCGYAAEGLRHCAAIHVPTCKRDGERRERKEGRA